jgi:hypothetical protein
VLRSTLAAAGLARCQDEAGKNIPVTKTGEALMIELLQHLGVKFEE